MTQSVAGGCWPPGMSPGERSAPVKISLAQEDTVQVSLAQDVTLYGCPLSQWGLPLFGRHLYQVSICSGITLFWCHFIWGVTNCCVTSDNFVQILVFFCPPVPLARYCWWTPPVPWAPSTAPPLYAWSAPPSSPAQPSTAPSVASLSVERDKPLLTSCRTALYPLFIMLWFSHLPHNIMLWYCHAQIHMGF